MRTLLTPKLLAANVALTDYLSTEATVLAQGMFSVVYDNHDGTVTKFTLDNSAYDWLTDNAYGMSRLSEDNPYKLPITQDIGEVGEIIFPGMNHGFGYTVYAVQMPKCERLFLKDLPKETADQVRWLKRTINEANRLSVRDPLQAKVLMSLHAEKALEITGSEHYSELAFALWYMVGDHDALPDTLLQGNIMSYNGHPVVIDPVFNCEVRKLAAKILTRTSR